MLKWLETLGIKSARVLEKMDELQDRLLKNVEGDPTHTSIKMQDDRPVFSKFVGTSILTAKAGDAIHGPSDEAAINELARKRGIDWKPSYKDRVIPYWASDERVDAHGDIVKQNWHFDEFEKNAPLPFSHNWGDLPIGQALDWKIFQRKDGDYNGPALWLLNFFAPAEVSKEADDVYKLVRAGILKGGSVGFYATKVIDIQDDKERAKLGLGKWGVILDENHLLEYSPTMLGANSGALAILANAKSAGLLTTGGVTLLRELHRQKVANGTRSKAEWEQTDGGILALVRTLFPSDRFESHKDLDTPFIADEERKLKAYKAPPPPPPPPPPAGDPAAAPADKPGTGDTTPALDEINKKLDALLEWGKGVTTIFNDIRTLLEQQAAGAAPAPAPDGNAPPAKGRKEDETPEGIRKVLEAVNKL